MPSSEPDPEPSLQRPLHNSLSSLLTAFAESFTSERVSIHNIMESLGHRSFGFVLFLFAIPNSLPIIGIPGVSTITGLPILFVAIQMALGYKRVYLPKWIMESSVPTTDFQGVMKKMTPWLERLEKLTKPRLSFLVAGSAERWLGAFCALLAFLLILPIPLGNLLPALGILFVSMGLIERDGVCVLVGLVIGVLSWFVLGGLVIVAIHSVIAMFHNFFG